MLKSKLLGATAAAELLAIEDVFSTYLYTGNGSTQTITNGIDLAGEGGLVWVKCRSAVTSHVLFDTERGPYDALLSNSTGAELNLNPHGVTSFGSAGFSLSDISSGINGVNGSPGGLYSGSSATYASWTFRKAPRFFDVVTYTGNGASSRAIPHNLGLTPNFAMVKRTDATSDWLVDHRAWSVSFGSGNPNNVATLNSANAFGYVGGNYGPWCWGSNNVNLTVGLNANASGASYVAYLFAHDPLGPSGDGSDGLIACGSYTGTGAAGNQITLGWEPQWLLVKNATTGGQNWEMFDNMRGVATGGIAAELFPNTSDDERAAFNIFNFNATGFETESTLDETNKSGDTYIYIVIRRGPMREPTVGTEVFAPITATGTESSGVKKTTGFPVDLQIIKFDAGSHGYTFDRLRGFSSNTTESGRYLYTSSITNEASLSGTRMWGNTGYEITGALGNLESIYWNFRRAPGFFDVVAYTGDGVAGRTVPHNLGVAPELMIFKRRNGARSWAVYCQYVGNGYDNSGNLETTNPFYGGVWNNTLPTATEITFSNSFDVNGSGATYIGYLFASLPGISKVGSYTGNGSSQTINCAFTTGARLVLVKATSTTGDWLIADTARGIVAGNDPYLELNTTNAEVTSEDWLDPDSSGFIVNEVAGSNANTNGVSYIYLAIS